LYNKGIFLRKKGKKNSPFTDLSRKNQKYQRGFAICFPRWYTPFRSLEAATLPGFFAEQARG
jgi:hypothetical protein